MLSPKGFVAHFPCSSMQTHSSLEVDRSGPAPINRQAACSQLHSGWTWTQTTFSDSRAQLEDASEAVHRQSGLTLCEGTLATRPHSGRYEGRRPPGELSLSSRTCGRYTFNSHNSKSCERHPLFTNRSTGVPLCS